MASFVAKVSSIKINEWFFESKCFKSIEKPIVWCTKSLFNIRLSESLRCWWIGAIGLLNLDTWFKSELKRDLNNICDGTVHL